MSRDEIAKLAKEWDSMEPGLPGPESPMSRIICALRTGTPERQAYNHAIMMLHIKEDWALEMYIRVLQAEAERSEV